MEKGRVPVDNERNKLYVCNGRNGMNGTTSVTKSVRRYVDG